MKKILLSAFVMLAAGCGIANASTEITVNNIQQPANDTLLFALPVDINCYQHIQNYPDFDPGMRMLKFQPEYLVTGNDFTKGDTEVGSAVLPAFAKVIKLGLEGYDVDSDPTAHGTFLEVTAWCKNVPNGSELNEYDQWFGNGYRIAWNHPDGQLLTDTITCRGYRNHPGYISTFEPNARDIEPLTIVDCPFNVKDEEGRNIPFLYTGESIYLTLWMCNWEDIHMKYRYMAYDDAELPVASLMRSGQYCFSSEVVDQIPENLLTYWYDLPEHRLPAFYVNYFTSDIRISQPELVWDYQLWQMNEGAEGQDPNPSNATLITPAEDGNFYNLDHTKQYVVVAYEGKYTAVCDFTDMYTDIEVEINNNITAVDEIGAQKTVSSVVYYNLAGQMSEQPVDGVNIVVTTYTDGTRTTAKVIK